MSEPNLVLDALLEKAGISRAGLAARVNLLSAATGHPTRYDHTAVARWIHDHAIPRGKAPDLICEILGQRLARALTLADIGMDRGTDHYHDVPLRRVIEQASALWRGDLKQETLKSTRLVRGAGAVAPVFEWENPPDDPDVSQHGARGVGMMEVRRLQNLRARYEQMYRRVGGIPTRPRIVTCLARQLTPLLKGSYDDKTGRELFRAAGGLVALAGVCAYDADLQPLAQRYLFHALRMAKASGNRGFGAYVVALLANQSMYLGNYRQVIQYAETALRAARGHLSPALVTDLHTLQAKAFARMGDRVNCHKHLRLSEATAAALRPTDEPPETGYVQPGLLECQHAEALRRLGDLRSAQKYAEEAARTAETSHPRGQIHRRAALALVLTEHGEVERAVHTATQILNGAQGMESWRIRDRVRTVTDALRRYKSRTVRDFLEQADQQLNVPM